MEIKILCASAFLLGCAVFLVNTRISLLNKKLIHLLKEINSGKYLTD